VRGRPIRVLLLVALVPLLVVVGLLAVAALDGRGAERKPAPTRVAAAAPFGSRQPAVAGIVRTDVGRGATGAAIFRRAGTAARTPGPVVVLLHGWTRIDPRIYGPWINHLVRGGATVIFPTYQAAPYLDTVSPLANTLAGLTVALRRVAVARGRLVVAGYSAGGALAADVAASARAARLPAPGAVLSIYPGRSLPRIPLRIPAVSARSIASGTRLVVLAGERDRLVGTRVARQIARTATRARVTMRIVRGDAVDDHGAPERRDAAARRTFWTPLDRLIAGTG
jgi:acetyl esterase/lipase